MTRRRMSTGLLALALAPLLLGGCGTLPDRLVEVNVITSKYDIDSGSITKAPEDGAYSLWEIRNPSQAVRKHECQLKKGDKLGFSSSGSYYIAVAGDERIYLHSPLGYGWFRDPEAVAPATATAEATTD